MVVVGVGTVGSQVAQELARSGVGYLRLIDGDIFELPNVVRHILPIDYVGTNKAQGVAELLAKELGVRTDPVTRDVDDSLSDSELDKLLEDADLIIATTDDRDTQRRLGRRALALDTPAIFPALYENGGGEVFVSLRPGAACFFCWDGFRPSNAALRSVTALNAETLSVIQIAVHLSLGLLDLRSEYARLYAPIPGDPRPRNLFVQRPFAALQHAVVNPRRGCPACQVGPARPESSRGTTATAAHVQPETRPQAGAGAPRQAPNSATASTGSPIASVAIVLAVSLALVGWLMAAVLHHQGPKRPDQALLRQIPARVSIDCTHITFSECPERGIIRDSGFERDYSEVMIRGLTKPLVDKLCKARYRDEWRDAQDRVMSTLTGSLCDPSAGFGPGYTVEWSWPDDPYGTQRVTNLIYLLEDIPLPGTNGIFTATWRLLDPNGRQVLQARYAATINRPRS